MGLAALDPFYCDWSPKGGEASSALQLGASPPNLASIRAGKGKEKLF